MLNPNKKQLPRLPPERLLFVDSVVVNITLPDVLSGNSLRLSTISMQTEQRKSRLLFLELWRPRVLVRQVANTSLRE